MIMDRASSYQCPVCYKNFKKFIFFEGHFSFDKNCCKNIGPYMQCYLCTEKFNNLPALKYHKKHFHKLDWTNKPAISTRQCHNETNISQSSGMSHGHDKMVRDVVVEEAISANASQQPERISFYCGLCGKGFPTKLHLNEHSTTHSIPIATCSNRVNRIDSKQKDFERRTVSNGKITKLELVQDDGMNGIEKSLKPKRLIPLKGSLLGRKIDDRVQCPVCKVKLSFSTNMQRHMKIHTFGTVACGICKIKFTRYTLTLHQRAFHSKHVESSRFRGPFYRQCVICKIRVYHTNLNRHMKVHSMGKKVCNICNVKFSDYALRQHQRLFHPQLFLEDTKTLSEETRQENHVSLLHLQQTYECNVCNKTFAAIRYWRQHNKTKRHLRNKEVSDPIDIETGMLSLKASDSCTYECYVCKRFLPTFDDLCEHMEKHRIYQQWIDPADVYLSNWSPAIFQEILQNQPLVLAENLNWKSLCESSSNSLTCKLKPMESMQQHDYPFDLADLNEDIFPIHYVTPDQNEMVNATESSGINENDASECRDLRPTYSFNDLFEEATSIHSVDYPNSGFGACGTAVPHSFESNDFSGLFSNGDITDDAMNTIVISSDDDEDDDVVII